MTKRFLVLLVLVTGPILSLACGASPPQAAAPPAGDGASSRPAACTEVAKACHEHDNMSSLARECHALGHSPSSTAEQCDGKRAACLKECPAKAGAH